MKKLYYVTELHLDENSSWNGLRTITIYTVVNNSVKTFAELECSSDDLGEYFLTDEEEIDQYLEDNGYGDEIYQLIQL